MVLVYNIRKLDKIPRNVSLVLLAELGELIYLGRMIRFQEVYCQFLDCFEMVSSNNLKQSFQVLNLDTLLSDYLYFP